MHPHRTLALALLAACAWDAAGRSGRAQQPATPPPTLGQMYSFGQEGLEPKDEPQKVHAYHFPESSGVTLNEGVAYILSEQLPTPDACGPFTLGGCDYEHGRRGFGCPHPWRTGPGVCDDWMVGPHWDATLDGVILHRKDLDVAMLDAQFGGAVARLEQFKYEPGARAYVTGNLSTGYEVQLGYVGVDQWRAFADYFLGGGIGNRDVEYRTGFHTAEMNFLTAMPGAWRLILGVRFAQLNEDIYVRDVDINVENSTHVDNKMIGFQVGGRRDLWQWGERFYLEGLINGGIYANRIDRFDNTGTVSGGTSIVRQVEENDLALLGEVALTSVWRLNNCVALRGGYQAIIFDGVTLAEDAFIGPGPTTTSVFYHGAQVGLEYRR